MRPRPAQTSDNSGGIARLEIAVYLPRPAHCDHQYAYSSQRRAAAIPAHLGKRDECVLYPAIRQHDLHDERHDHPAQFTGGFSQTYDSLSKVAFAITGTKWNGPRFFGLCGGWRA